MDEGRTVPPGMLEKASTGISGLDEITGGGLPRGRPTLVCGGAGCGKTLLAMEFLVQGARRYGEPGVFVAFEEDGQELEQNMASLRFDLRDLAERGLLVVDHVELEPGPVQQAGEYDLSALFARIGYAIDSIHARRVALDSLETLFGTLPNEAILRTELRRLFRFLKSKGVTVVITGERGDGTLTRHGLEEYVSDCVILLEHVLREHVLTRYLRVVKYRGAAHGTNEYPFLIDRDGISVLPITVLGLEHSASVERISTGIQCLDTMLGRQGIYRGSSVLISGTAGTGKTSIAARCADASCRRGERCLFFAFEESPDQIVRNMLSVGTDLRPWLSTDLLRFHPARPTMHGLEMHLVICHKQVEAFAPELVILDPVSAFTSIGSTGDAAAMLVRLIDFLKGRQITAILTDLTAGGASAERTEVGISSLMDTWLLLRSIEWSGEQRRTLHVLKSRGMAHSNQIREFILSDDGIQLLDVLPERATHDSSRREMRSREEHQ